MAAAQASGNQGSANRALSVQDAKAELDLMIQIDTSGAIQQFQKWYRAYDRALEGLDEEKVAIILRELGRSSVGTPASSRHAAWKVAQSSLRFVRRWMRNKKNWSDAFQSPYGENHMPYMPTSTALLALRYLDLGTANLPETIQKQFNAASLGWHLSGTGEPPDWWVGAKLDDEDWRRRYMQPAAKARRISLNFGPISHYMVLSFRGDATKLNNAAVEQTEPNLNGNERKSKRRAASPDNERESRRRAPSPDYERKSRRPALSPDYEGEPFETDCMRSCRAAQEAVERSTEELQRRMEEREVFYAKLRSGWPWE